MFTQNEYIAMQINHDARARAAREAGNLRRLRAAGLLPRPVIIRAARAAAGFIYRALIAAGRRTTARAGRPQAEAHSAAENRAPALRSDSRA